MRSAAELRPGDRIALGHGSGEATHTVVKADLDRLGYRCVWLTRTYSGRTTQPQKWRVGALQASMDHLEKRRLKRMAPELVKLVKGE